MSITPSEGETGRRGAARPDDGERGRSFKRRIECDGATNAPPPDGPARGGGLREPDAWRRRGQARG
jgi:hypothetical protein